MNSIKCCTTTEAKPNCKLEAGQWAFYKQKGQFGDVVGNVRMVVATADLKATKKEVAGRSLKVGGAELVIEISDVAELVQEGTTPRGGRPRGGAARSRRLRFLKTCTA